MRLDFIVIGASRSGTTWIHDNLEVHPEIQLPSKVGEPHFFSKNYEKGLAYYEALFEGFTESKKIGEVTPDYIFSEKAPERMKELSPNVKLILSLRNPIDRLYSMYWILRGKFEEENQFTFEEKLENHPELIQQGFYINYIDHYLKTFPKEQILVLQFDEIKTSPEAFLKKIYEFIGVNADYQSPYVKTKINRATFRKYYSKSKVLFFSWRILKKFGLNKWAYRIEKANSKSTPPMNPVTREKLIEIYRPFNARLELLLGVDLTHWNK